YCPFRIILVRLRIAEERQHPIAKVLGHGAAEARHHVGGGVVILRYPIAPLLGIELRAQLGGADEVAEEHCQLAALARRQSGFGLGGRRRCRHWWQPLTAAPTELLTGLKRGTARGTRHGERGAALRAEAPVRAVVVVTRRAVHGVSSPPG